MSFCPRCGRAADASHTALNFVLGKPVVVTLEVASVYIRHMNDTAGTQPAGRRKEGKLRHICLRRSKEAYDKCPPFQQWTCNSTRKINLLFSDSSTEKIVHTSSRR
jgi:hypothetical protein